jgi:tellurite resistance protein TerC
MMSASATELEFSAVEAATHMVAVSLFSFAEYWWFYAAFALFVLGMLALDLGVFHRQAHEVSAREALTWSAVWTAIAIGFAGVLYGYCAWKLPLP